MVYKLMVVDSDPAVPEWLESHLRPAGFEITTFEDGISALDMLSSLDPDLVLIEQNLKGLNLSRFCDKLRQKSLTKKRPLILLANATDPLSEDQIRLAGVTDVVMKPLQMERLLEKIGTHLGAPSTPTVGAEKTPPTPGKTPPIAREDQKEVEKIEELLGWSLPGEKTIMAAFEKAAPAANVDDDRTIVESSLLARKETAGPAAEPAPPRPASEEPPGEARPSAQESFPEKDPSTEMPFTRTTMAELAQESGPPPRRTSPRQSPSTETFESTALQEAPPSATGPMPSQVSPELVQAEVRRIVREIIEKVAWDVVPGMAETLIKEEIERLKSGRS